MAIVVQCSGCGGRLRVRDEWAGKRVKCPKCSALTKVGSIVHEPTATESGPPGTPPNSSVEAPPQARSVPEESAGVPVKSIAGGGPATSPPRPASGSRGASEPRGRGWGNPLPASEDPENPQPARIVLYVVTAGVVLVAAWMLLRVVASLARNGMAAFETLPTWARLFGRGGIEGVLYIIAAVVLVGLLSAAGGVCLLRALGLSKPRFGSLAIANIGGVLFAGILTGIPAAVFWFLGIGVLVGLCLLLMLPAAPAMCCFLIRSDVDSLRGWLAVASPFVIMYFLLLQVILLPHVIIAREAGRRSHCSNNLKRIALAFHNSATQNRRLPSTLDELSRFGIDKSVLTCPSASAAAHAAPHYEWRFPAATQSPLETPIIAWDREANHARGRNVLFANGVVVYLSDAEYQLIPAMEKKMLDYYASVREFTGGKTVREWAARKPLDEQCRFSSGVLAQLLAGEKLP